jgi:hypothetical protein
MRNEAKRAKCAGCDLYVTDKECLVCYRLEPSKPTDYEIHHAKGVGRVIQNMQQSR